MNRFNYFIVFIMLSLAGCATYDAYQGSRRPRNEVAVLIANDFIEQQSDFDKTIYLKKVNGLAIGKDKVAVLPGPCKIEVGISIKNYGFQGKWATSAGNISIGFDAVANSEYFIRGDIVDDTSWKAEVYRGGVGKVATAIGQIILRDAPNVSK